MDCPNCSGCGCQVELNPNYPEWDGLCFVCRGVTKPTTVRQAKARQAVGIHDHPSVLYALVADAQTAEGIGAPDADPTEEQMLALLWQPTYIPVLEELQRGNYHGCSEDGEEDDDADALKAAYAHALEMWACADCGEICGDDDSVWDCACEPEPAPAAVSPEPAAPQGEQTALFGIPAETTELTLAETQRVGRFAGMGMLGMPTA